jgi:hypothetical protein
MPSVAMNAFTRSLVMISPFARPTPAPNASTSATAGTTFAGDPSMVSAPSSELRLIS